VGRLAALRAPRWAQQATGLARAQGRRAGRPHLKELKKGMVSCRCSGPAMLWLLMPRQCRLLQSRPRAWQRLMRIESDTCWSGGHSQRCSHHGHRAGSTAL